MPTAWRKLADPLVLGALLACGAGGAARAQFFFQPFHQSWRQDVPPAPEEQPRFGSRRSVARILARAGYELVGPLGRRGDQIVATGVSRRDGATRFFIDPYEGAILHAMRLAPPAANGRDWGDERSPAEAEGTRPPARAAGRDRPPRDEARAPARPPGETATARPLGNVPPEKSAEAAPSSPAQTTETTAKRPTASSRRAIVPPRPAGVTTTATPSTSPHSDAKTPASDSPSPSGR